MAYRSLETPLRLKSGEKRERLSDAAASRSGNPPSASYGGHVGKLG